MKAALFSEQDLINRDSHFSQKLQNGALPLRRTSIVAEATPKWPPARRSLAHPNTSSGHPPPTQTRRSSSTLKRPLLPRAWKHEVTESSPDSFDMQERPDRHAHSAIAELGGTIASMKLSGIQKLTLLDFPGRTAATVFTPGCNFRCPFCHNADLVLGERSVTTCAPGSGNGGVT